MFGAPSGANVFDAARKTLDLTGEAKAGVDLLNAQFTDEFDAAVTELRMKMTAAYVTKILDLLPEEEKPKYEAVAKALADREQAVAAAEKELKAVLDKVKAEQGADKVAAPDDRPRFGPPGGDRDSKADILHTCFVLTEEQQQKLENTRREAFGGMRDRMREAFRGMRDLRDDPNARLRVRNAMRQVREDVDEDVAAAAADFLTDDQKKGYLTACTAIDLCRKKRTDADEACRAAIAKAVGEEKANALLGPPPGQAQGAAKGTEF
jgi:hypothetical protein